MYHHENFEDSRTYLPTRVVHMRSLVTRCATSASSGGPARSASRSNASQRSSSSVRLQTSCLICAHLPHQVALVGTNTTDFDRDPDQYLVLLVICIHVLYILIYSYIISLTNFFSWLLLDLKRFSGEGYRSSKMSGLVEFPIERFDISKYSASEGQSVIMNV